MRLSPGEAERLLRENAPWFYKYRFEGGSESASMQPLIDEIHQVRADLIFPLLDLAYDGKWRSLRCLDIGCHEGWFSFQLAVRGASEVIGTDVRDEHLHKANVIRSVSGLDNATFKKCSVYDLARAGLGTFDLTFFVGLLYHLDNPVGSLTAVRAMTRNLCVIETQVARAAPDLECLWGSDEGTHRGPGIVVVRSDPNHVEGDRSVVLVPTLKALYELLHSAGFNQCYLAVARPGMYRQYPDYDRVVVFAQV
jgi:hypothetical protein